MCIVFTAIKEFSVIEHIAEGILLPGNASGAVSWVKCSLICLRILNSLFVQLMNANYFELLNC